MSDTRERLQTFLSNEISSYDKNRPLFDQVSSLDFLTLVARIEKEFGIRFQNHELKVENFISLETLLGVMEEKF